TILGKRKAAAPTKDPFAVFAQNSNASTEHQPEPSNLLTTACRDQRLLPTRTGASKIPRQRCYSLKNCDRSDYYLTACNASPVAVRPVAATLSKTGLSALA